MAKVHRINNVRRLPNANNGNPVWELETTGGRFTTNPDSKVGDTNMHSLVNKSVMLQIHNGKVFGFSE